MVSIIGNQWPFIVDFPIFPLKMLFPLIAWWIFPVTTNFRNLRLPSSGAEHLFLPPEAAEPMFPTEDVGIDRNL